MALTDCIISVCLFAAEEAESKDDTTEEANITPAHPDNLSFHNSEQAPRRRFGATKEFLNYKYIYINIPGLYSSNSLTSTHYPHTPPSHHDFNLFLLLDIIMKKRHEI